MNRSLPIVILCLTILYSAPARGDELVKAGQACCDTPHGCLPPRIPGCLDDYCRKPTPCMVGLSCWTCDDYCRKPIPCILSLSGCASCDDYCRKPLPSFCWPMLNLSCVSTCSKYDPSEATKALRPSKVVRAKSAEAKISNHLRVHSISDSSPKASARISPVASAPVGIAN